MWRACPVVLSCVVALAPCDVVAYGDAPAPLKRHNAADAPQYRAKGDAAFARGEFLVAATWYWLAQDNFAANAPYGPDAMKARKAWFFGRLEQASALQSTDPGRAWALFKAVESRRVQWPIETDWPLATRGVEESRRAWLDRLVRDADVRIARGEAERLRVEAVQFSASVDALTAEERAALLELLARCESAAAASRAEAGRVCIARGMDAGKHLAAWQAVQALQPLRLREAAAHAPAIAALESEMKAALARRQVEVLLANPPDDTLAPATAHATWTAAVDLAQGVGDPALLAKAVAGRQEWSLRFARRLEAARRPFVTIPEAALLRRILTLDGTTGPHATLVRQLLDATVGAFRQQASMARNGASSALWLRALAATGEDVPTDRLKAAVTRELERFRPAIAFTGLRPACRDVLALGALASGGGPRVVVDCSNLNCNTWDSNFAPDPARFAQRSQRVCRRVTRETVVVVDQPCGQETVFKGEGRDRWSYVVPKTCQVEQVVPYEEEVCENQSSVQQLSAAGQGRRSKGVYVNGSLELVSATRKGSLLVTHHVPRDVKYAPGEAPPPMPSYQEIFQYAAGLVNKALDEQLLEFGQADAAALKHQLWLTALKSGPEADGARDLLLAVDNLAPGTPTEPLAASLGLTVPMLGPVIRGDWALAFPAPTITLPVPAIPACDLAPAPVPHSLSPVVPVPEVIPHPEVFGIDIYQTNWRRPAPEVKTVTLAKPRSAGGWRLGVGVSTSLVAPGALDTVTQLEGFTGTGGRGIDVRAVLDIIVPALGPTAGFGLRFDFPVVAPDRGSGGKGWLLLLGTGFERTWAGTRTPYQSLYLSAYAHHPLGPVAVEVDFKLNSGLRNAGDLILSPSPLSAALVASPFGFLVLRAGATYWWGPGNELTFSGGLGLSF